MEAARGRRGDRFDIPLFLFLLGALPAAQFYENNFRLLPLTDLIRPVLTAWVMIAALLAVGRLVWPRSGSAALVLAPLTLVLFKGADLGGPLSIALTAVTVGLGVLLRRRPADWPRRLGLPLNAALAVLVALPLLDAAHDSGADRAPQPSGFFASEIPLPAAAAAGQRPDIYFLVVDGLGQPAYVEAKYPITAAAYSRPLADLGFRVLQHAFSNYPQTALSLAATLNLGLVDQVLDIPNAQSRDRRVLQEVVGDSRVVRALKRLGYDIVSYPSGYPLTRQADADVRRRPLLNPTFGEFYLVEDGVLPLLQPLLGLGRADFSYALRRARLDYIFDDLPSARDGVDDDDPVFVFAHILAPHPPFVFAADGSPVPSRAAFAYADGDHWLNVPGRSGNNYRRRYADQATWVMHRLAGTIARIQASSDRPKVIIVQGDHGPGADLKWERPLETDHNERFGIFNAWYVSDGRPLAVYEGMTALNTFPVLFNGLFDTGLPRLPDRHWFARMSRPYDLLPVEQ